MATEYEEGDYRIAYLDVTPNDGTTVVTLAVESPLGVITTPTPRQAIGGPRRATRSPRATGTNAGRSPEPAGARPTTS